MQDKCSVSFKNHRRYEGSNQTYSWRNPIETDKKFTTADSIVRDNRRCEEKLLDILPLPLDAVITEEKFIDISLDKMHKTKIPMLTAFIKIRMNSNFNTHVVIASLKVNPVDVRNKVVDKKQRDSCCLSKLIRLDH